MFIGAFTNFEVHYPRLRELMNKSESLASMIIQNIVQKSECKKSHSTSLFEDDKRKFILEYLE